MDLCCGKGDVAAAVLLSTLSADVDLCRDQGRAATLLLPIASGAVDLCCDKGGTVLALSLPAVPTAAAAVAVALLSAEGVVCCDWARAVAALLEAEGRAEGCKVRGSREREPQSPLLAVVTVDK